MGPVEQQLREQLKQGAMSRDDVRRQLGHVALWQFDKLLRVGALELAGDGRWRLKVYRLDASEIAARKAAQEQARRTREQLLELEAQRCKEQNRRRRAEEEQRALFEGLGSYSREERLCIVEERKAAIAESRAYLAEQEDSNREPARLASGA